MVIAVGIVRKIPNQIGVAVRPHRRGVERFFAWFNGNRCLAKDLEAAIDSALALIYAVSIMLLIRRLARAS